MSQRRNAGESDGGAAGGSVGTVWDGSVGRAQRLTTLRAMPPCPLAVVGSHLSRDEPQLHHHHSKDDWTGLHLGWGYGCSIVDERRGRIYAFAAYSKKTESGHTREGTRQVGSWFATELTPAAEWTFAVALELPVA